MSFQSLSHVPAWTLLPIFSIGFSIGLLYFRALWGQAQRLTAGGGVVSTIGLMLGRFALLGGVLMLASFQGALPLLMLALGILLARPFVIRRVRKASS